MEKKYSIKKAALINAAGKYSKILLGLVVNAILARMLSPEDYGIVAIITVFSTFFTTFSDMGFGTAIIQKKDLSSEDINNIYSFTVYISFGLMLLFIILSYFIAYFYNDKVYIGLGQLLSISLLFNSLNMVPNGILNRDKKFISISLRTIIVYLSSAIITIILVFLGLSYYALVIQAILTALFTFIWNFITTKPKFKIRFNRESIDKILNYSGYQFAFNIVNYFSRNLDNLLTGKFLGNKELGYYNKAYTLMLYPISNLTGVISPVLHPILSDFQDKLDIIYHKYMRIIKLLLCISIYVESVCILGSAEIIEIMYGANWDKSIICFKLLSIAMISQMVNASTGAVFQAIGKTKLLFITSCINTGISIIAILVGVFIGKSIEVLSLCVAIAYLLHFFIAFFIMMKFGFDHKLRNFIKELSAYFVILIIMGISVLLYPFNINGVLISLLIKCIYLGLIYLICLFISGEYKSLRIIFRK